MKLFKLPYLCQKEVFSEMHFSTRYTFTFGTRRMKIWAKCLQKTLKSPELQVEIGEAAMDVAFSVRSGKRVEKIMDLARTVLNPDETIVMKFGDLELKCELTFTPNMVIKYDQLLSPTPQILDPICEFFKSTKSEIVYILHDYSCFTNLPSIPIQKSVLRLRREILDSGFIGDFYRKYPDQQFSMVQIEGDAILSIPNDFQMLQTRNLILNNIIFVDMPFLDGFKGENAVFQGGMILTSGINSFLKSWMNRDSDELKTVIVETTCPVRENNIFDGIPHTREQNRVLYPYSSIIQDYHDFPEDTFDCSNTFSITRHAGTPREKKATVKITRNSFMFLVWD